MSPTSPLTLVHEHWQVSISLSLAAAVAGSLYLWGVGRVGRGWPWRRTLCFLGGIACVLVALDSGLGSYDDLLLSAHMTQHMLLLLLAPLLLLFGHPLLLALRALPPRRRPGLARALGHLRGRAAPALALLIFSLVVLATHLPSFYDATLRHPLLHDTEHALYLAAGLVLWWPLLGGDPAPAHRLGGLARLGYLLLAMIPMALVGAYLNRHAGVVYAPYGPTTRGLGLSPVADQADAGAIMWVVGNITMIAVGLWVIFAALVAEERRQQRREARAAPAPAAQGPRR
jgi:putative membrane protein